MTVAVSVAFVRRVEQSGGRRGGIEYEGELAALREQHRALDRLAALRAQHACDNVNADPLQQHVDEHGREDEPPLARDEREIERHADGEEEKAEQDAAERNDVGFQLMPERGFRKHHAGEECAERHGEAAHLHEECRAEHDEKCGRRHHLARLRASQHAEHRVEQPFAGRDERSERDDRDADVFPARARRRHARNGRQQRDEGEEGHDREIFEQEDRDRALALGRRALAALVEDLHDDRGRREREAHGRDEGDDRRETGSGAGDRQERPAHDHLQRAEPEDLPPQRPEARRLHLEPDHEQEQHDAELGDVEDRLGLREDAEPERSDHDAGGEITEHGAEAKALEQGRADHARGE